MIARKTLTTVALIALAAACAFTTYRATALTAYQIRVDCIYWVNVDGLQRCGVFEYDGYQYATQYAPTIPVPAEQEGFK